MTNGNKAAMKRERNAKKNVKPKEKADAKVLQAAIQAYKCGVCMQTFMVTSRKQELEVHVTNKHTDKSFEQCFPNFAVAVKPAAPKRKPENKDND